MRKIPLGKNAYWAFLSSRLGFSSGQGYQFATGESFFGRKSKISIYAGWLVFALLEPAVFLAARPDAGKFAGIYRKIGNSALGPHTPITRNEKCSLGPLDAPLLAGVPGGPN